MNNFTQHSELKEDNSLYLTFVGEITEFSEINFCNDSKAKKVMVNTKNIKRINSSGVRTWINAIKSVPENISIEFHECSLAIIDQVNMISNFVGSHDVIPLYIPMTCDECGYQTDLLLDINESLHDNELEIPAYSCKECESDLSMDEDPEYLFSFLFNKINK